ncbi:hypothetical protein GcM3_189031 [Golovinomyces cichoracearum]|uniref:Uncharacterized protein n=1 Tax=Golovinomyces cichoracearum TaxID=62708 RepID=A0A420HIM8_9PEZI|nr:hypothetical protein GcM3_189031 [Golovinomyces cichoracearum]
MKNRNTSAYIQEWEGNENDQNSEIDDESFYELTLETQDLELEHVTVSAIVVGS